MNEPTSALPLSRRLPLCIALGPAYINGTLDQQNNHTSKRKNGEQEESKLDAHATNGNNDKDHDFVDFVVGDPATNIVYYSASRDAMNHSQSFDSKSNKFVADHIFLEGPSNVKDIISEYDQSIKPAVLNSSAGEEAIVLCLGTNERTVDTKMLGPEVVSLSHVEEAEEDKEEEQVCMEQESTSRNKRKKKNPMKQKRRAPLPPSSFIELAVQTLTNEQEKNNNITPIVYISAFRLLPDGRVRDALRATLQGDTEAPPFSIPFWESSRTDARETDNECIPTSITQSQSRRPNRSDMKPTYFLPRRRRNNSFSTVSRIDTDNRVMAPGMLKVRVNNAMDVRKVLQRAVSVTDILVSESDEEHTVVVLDIDRGISGPNGRVCFVHVSNSYAGEFASPKPTSSWVHTLRQLLTQVMPGPPFHRSKLTLLLRQALLGKSHLVVHAGLLNEDGGVSVSTVKSRYNSSGLAILLHLLESTRIDKRTHANIGMQDSNKIRSSIASSSTIADFKNDAYATHTAGAELQELQFSNTNEMLRAEVSSGIHSDVKNICADGFTNIGDRPSTKNALVSADASKIQGAIGQLTTQRAELEDTLSQMEHQQKQFRPANTRGNIDIELFQSRDNEADEVAMDTLFYNSEREDDPLKSLRQHIIDLTGQVSDFKTYKHVMEIAVVKLQENLRHVTSERDTAFAARDKLVLSGGNTRRRDSTASTRSNNNAKHVIVARGTSHAEKELTHKIVKLEDELVKLKHSLVNEKRVSHMKQRKLSTQVRMLKAQLAQHTETQYHAAKVKSENESLRAQVSRMKQQLERRSLRSGHVPQHMGAQNNSQENKLRRSRDDELVFGEVTNAPSTNQSIELPYTSAAHKDETYADVTDMKQTEPRLHKNGRGNKVASSDFTKVLLQELKRSRDRRTMQLSGRHITPHISITPTITIDENNCFNDSDDLMIESIPQGNRTHNNNNNNTNKNSSDMSRTSRRWTGNRLKESDGPQRVNIKPALQSPRDRVDFFCASGERPEWGAGPGVRRLASPRIPAGGDNFKDFSFRNNSR